MRIELWSDYVCPFCYIGKRLLEQALEKVPYKDQVEVIFKAYELDPTADNSKKISSAEHLAKKYNMSIDEVKAMTEQITARAAETGLEYNLENTRTTNTLDAHRIVKFAEQKGKGAALSERILRAYFTESKFIGSHDILTELAVEVGLDKEEVHSVLFGSAYTSEVRADQQEARQIGVQGVPFFVFNRKYAVSGAQPLELFSQTLEKVWQEENPAPSLQQINSTDGAVCTGDSCIIPNNSPKI